MKLLIPISLILTLFLSSCSSTYVTWDRSIANEVETPVTSDDLFTIKSTNDINNMFNQSDGIKARIQQLFQMDAEVIVDPKMPTDIAFKFEPVIENQKYKLRIISSATGIHDMAAALELVRVFEKFFNDKFISIYSLFELTYNVKMNDFPSMLAMAKIREEVAKGVGSDSAKYWTGVNEEFKKQERLFNKKKKVLTEERKAVMDALDKVAEDQQFRNLVAKNDRKGAAKLLRSYLPWEEMPPFEKLFWETHLKVMADPLPIEQRIFVYRGIDDDVIQKAQLAGKALTEEEAIKEQKIFLMSTMMTKNQGTWNRRLRSLTAMYEKFMGTNQNGSSEFTSTTRITNMFKKHSIEPKGSPFLSLTPDIAVARNFGYKKTSGYFLDPRMMYFNNTSGYQHEVEFLIPITTFPDDLGGVYSLDIHGQGNFADVIRNAAIEKLDKKLGAGKGKEAYEKIINNSNEYFRPVMGKTGVVKPIAVDGNATGLLKKVLGKTTEEAAQALDGNQTLRCMDLIHLFWN